MMTGKLSTRGQIVIPQELRKKFQSKKGDVWEFITGDEPNVILMRKVSRKTNEGVAAHLAACPHDLAVPPKSRELPRKVKL